MCTLIVMRDLFRWYPLVVAANRDEDLARPSSPPRVWEGSPRLLAPVDERGGGAWLGVSERGIFAAVTNRAGIPHDPAKPVSRGALVLAALEAQTAEEAAERMAAADAGLSNGYHLVIADRERAFILYGSGGGRPSCAELGGGLAVVTERGARMVGEPAAYVPDGALRRVDRVALRLHRSVGRHPPRPAGLSELLDLHDGADQGGATCRHGRGSGWGTRSSTVVRFADDAAELWHREGREDGGVCGEKWTGPLVMPFST